MKSNFTINEIKDYLEEVKLEVIATSLNDKPWAASVFFAFDEKLNIYFMSSLARRHSEEILKNKRVAFAIVFHENLYTLLTL